METEGLNIIKKEYVTKFIVVDKQTISRFLRPEWHREFREAHIKQIMNGMKHGKHPSESITINANRNTQTARVINGNHRISAVGRLIEENPDFSIEMTFTVYYNLSKEEEIEVYERVNNTKKENGLDRLKAYMVGTKIHKMIMNSFPFKVTYGAVGKDTKNIMKMNEVLAAYIYRNKVNITTSTTSLIKEAPNLETRDYDRMVAFARVFLDTCGEPSRTNICASYNVYSVFSKLYYALVGTDLNVEQYKNKIMKIMLRHNSELIFYSQGVHKQAELYNFVFKKIKGSRTMFNVVTGKRE